MTKDLVRIVESAEQALACVPRQYLVTLDRFSREDNKILAAYRLGERSEKTHYSGYREWEALVGKEEGFTNPAGYLAKARKSLEDNFKVIERPEFKIKILSVTHDYRAIQAFGGISELCHRQLRITERFYEGVVAHAKEIAAETSVKPKDVPKTEEGRDAIMRRIFPRREQYDGFIQLNKEQSLVLLACSDVIRDALMPTIERMRTNFLGRMITRKAYQAFQKLPPKHVYVPFVQEDAIYDRQRGDRIYGVNPGVSPSDIIDV